MSSKSPEHPFATQMDWSLSPQLEDCAHRPPLRSRWSRIVATVPKALHDIADPLALPQLMVRAGVAGATGFICCVVSRPKVTSNSARQPFPAMIVVLLYLQLSPSRHALVPRFRTSLTRAAVPPVPQRTWIAEPLPQVTRRVPVGVVGVGVAPR